MTDGFLQALQKLVGPRNRVTFQTTDHRSISGDILEFSPDFVVIRDRLSRRVEMLSRQAIGSASIEEVADGVQSHNDRHAAPSAPAVPRISNPGVEAVLSAAQGNPVRHKRPPINLVAPDSIELPRLDFSPSFLDSTDLPVNSRVVAKRALDRAANIYATARRLNEMARCRAVPPELVACAANTPSLGRLRILAARMLDLAGDRSKAIVLARQIAGSGDPAGWLLLSKWAEEDGNLPAACARLTFYFHLSRQPAPEPVWNRFVGIVIGINAAGAWRELAVPPSRDDALLENLARGIQLHASHLNAFDERRRLDQVLASASIGSDELLSIAKDLTRHVTESDLRVWDQAWAKELSTAEDAEAENRRTALAEVRKDLDSIQRLKPDGEITRYEHDSPRVGEILAKDGTLLQFRLEDVADVHLRDDLLRLGMVSQLPVKFQRRKTDGVETAGVVCYPPGVVTVLADARSRANGGRNDQALSLVDQVLADYPANEQAMGMRQQLSRPKLQSTPSVAPAIDPYKDRYKNALRFLEAADFNSAEAELQKLIAGGQKNDQVIKAMAQVLERRDGRPKAIEYLDAELVNLKDLRPSLNELERMSTIIGRHEMALKYLDEVMKVSNRTLWPSIYKRKAFSFYSLKQIDMALREIKSALDIAPDDPAAIKLKQTLEAAEKSGDFSEATAVFTRIRTKELEADLDDVLRFDIDRCTYYGVAAHLKQSQDFNRATVAGLQRITDGPLKGRFEERAEALLSLAVVLKAVEPDNHDAWRRNLYKFAIARGDFLLSDPTRSRDAVRSYYAAACSVETKKDSLSAYVSKFIVSFMTEMPDLSTGTSISIPEALDRLFGGDEEPIRSFWDWLLYLFVQNGDLINDVLQAVYHNARALKSCRIYLKAVVGINADKANLTSLKRTWDDQRQERRNEWMEWEREIGSITDSTLQSSTCPQFKEALIKNLPEWLPDVDRQRLRELAPVFDHALNLFRDKDFQARYNGYLQANVLLSQIRDRIERNPTRFSCRTIYPLVEWLIARIGSVRDDLLATTEPRVTISPAVEQVDMVEAPGADHGRTRLRLVVTNGDYCQPVDQFVLRFANDPDVYERRPEDQRWNSAVAGGSSVTIPCEVYLKQKWLDNRAVELRVSLVYVNRQQEEVELPEQGISVRLYPVEAFREIKPNPYAPYIESGAVVVGSSMYFGREAFVAEVANALIANPRRAHVIAGQKRVGKSTVLEYLRSELDEKGLFSVTLSIGDFHAGAASSKHESGGLVLFCYTICFRIFEQLGELQKQGKSAPRVEKPAVESFYTFPTVRLQEWIFDFKQTCDATEGWKDRRLVLLIDEFTYLHSMIKSGSMPAEIMKTFKSWIETERFNAVLVAQDTMPRFVEDFPNELSAVHIHSISYLEKEHAAQLLEKPILLNEEKRITTRYVGRALSDAVELTAGSPYYGMILGYHLVKYMNSTSLIYVTSADVAEVAKIMCAELPDARFDNLAAAGDWKDEPYAKGDVMSVLSLIATRRAADRSGCTRSEIVSDPESPAPIDPKTIDAILDDLKRRRVILFEREKYRIVVPLFERWLRANANLEP